MNVRIFSVWPEHDLYCIPVQQTIFWPHINVSCPYAATGLHLSSEILENLRRIQKFSE